jgi:pyruvate kinase
VKPFDIIATVSGRLAESGLLQGLVERGATILRINGAHVSAPEAARLVGLIRTSVGQRAKILIDLPGNKIRTANLDRALTLKAGETFHLKAGQFNFPGFVAYLKPGNELLASDGRLRFVVEQSDANEAVLTAKFDGLLENRKGVHLVGGHLDQLPFLFDHDRALVRVAREQGADLVGLSYVRRPADVEEARALLDGSSVGYICKVETREACECLDAILSLTKHVLIDRGDLSSEIGLYGTPAMERRIVRRAVAHGVKVFVATQILYNMVQYPIPLMAEVSALHDLATYADGIQLSDETAAGKFPFEALDVVRQMRETAWAEQTSVQSAGAGAVIWLTGRSGSGKTTLASALIQQLQLKGIRTVFVDGDDARAFTGGALGYSKEARETHLKYMAFASHKAAQSVAVVVVAALSPFEHIRQWTRSRIANYFEVYVNCPLDECMERDPKGYYARATKGQMSDFVGVDMEYEVPGTPELTIDTSRMAVGACVEHILQALGKAGYLSS